MHESGRGDSPRPDSYIKIRFSPSFRILIPGVHSEKKARFRRGPGKSGMKERIDDPYSPDCLPVVQILRKNQCAPCLLCRANYQAVPKRQPEENADVNSLFNSSQVNRDHFHIAKIVHDILRDHGVNLQLRRGGAVELLQHLGRDDRKLVFHHVSHYGPGPGLFFAVMAVQSVHQNIRIQKYLSPGHDAARPLSMFCPPRRLLLCP